MNTPDTGSRIRRHLRPARFVRRVGVGIAIVALSIGGSLAQDYPARPIRFVVPTGAGTTTDLIARVLGQEMSKLLGQAIVVENRTGANQIIGLEHIARQSPADGYTVGVVGTDGMALLPLTTKELRFDPMRDLVPVTAIAESRYVLIGPSARPWKTFQELVAHARANPGKLNYGSSAHQVRFPVLVLIQELGIDVVHIPYSGGGPYLQAIAAGTIDLGIGTEAAAGGLGKRVQLYAVTGSRRIASYPEVPTFGELGFPQIRGPAYALAMRSGTPQPVLDKVGVVAAAVIDQPEVKATFAKMLLEVNNDRADVARRRLADQARFYADLARRINLSPE